MKVNRITKIDDDEAFYCMFCGYYECVCDSY